jgi:hypothetical protein
MFASLVVNAHDFTDPVQGAIETALPIVLGFIAAVFAIGLVIKWVMRTAQYELREREYQEYERGERDSVG